MRLAGVLFGAVLFALAACLVTPPLGQVSSLIDRNGTAHLKLLYNNFGTAADTPPPTSAAPPSDEDPEDAVWRKAHCRGSALLKALTLDEEESSQMLQWPYTQSPWDGDLKDALRTWGYLDEPTTHEQNDHHCDFDNSHHSKRAFEALGLDWRSADQGGPNHCFYVQHANGPAVILDEETHLMPEPRDQRYEVDGTLYKVRSGDRLRFLVPRVKRLTVNR
jgi:hypothetical protein